MSANNISLDKAFDLELVQEDIISDILFLIGTLISLNLNTRAEQEIICPEETPLSNEDSVAKKSSNSGRIIIVILLFLAGTAILAYTSYIRLIRQKAELTADADQTVINNISGGELALMGFLIRIVGYVISVIGNRIKADNPV